MAKIIIILFAISIAACHPRINPEQATAIDSNFSVIQAQIKDLNERLKRVEKPNAEPSRSK
jgi:hypothetical protein